MFDIKWIREHPEEFDNGIARRKLEPQSASLIALDKERREVETRAQVLQANRNKLSKEVGVAKAKGKDTEEIISQLSRSKEAQATAEEALSIWCTAARGLSRTTAKAGLHF